MATSMQRCSAKLVSGTRSRRAKAAVVSEVGIPTTRKPFLMRAAKASTANAAVDPLPSPRIMPSSTSSMARAAAMRFGLSCFDGKGIVTR
jgi:hypothetical protein